VRAVAKPHCARFSATSGLPLTGLVFTARIRGRNRVRKRRPRLLLQPRRPLTAPPAPRLRRRHRARPAVPALPVRNRRKGVRLMLKGFKEFIMRGNVIDLAVAVVIGAAFTAIVNALVEGLLNPALGALF